MTRKLRRNTAPATKQATIMSRKRQHLVREIIRLKIFKKSCTCNKCFSGDYSYLCTSYGNIAKLANDNNIPTVTGLKGKWKKTQVARLFPESTHKLENKNVLKTSLDGLI